MPTAPADKSFFQCILMALNHLFFYKYFFYYFIFKYLFTLITLWLLQVMVINDGTHETLKRVCLFVRAVR